ncbi:protein of unknown function [Hyphomicrobium sp. 1Nfss2.1]
MTEPLRVTVFPLDPLQVAEEPQVPLAQLEAPLRLTVPPLGPV